MAVSSDDDAGAGMTRPHRIALLLLQAALLACAGFKLYRIVRHDGGVGALAWSVPWIILVAVAIVLIPVLCRLGWRRFGRPAPMWAVAATVSISVWMIATVLCWMALNIVLIMSD